MEERDKIKKKNNNDLRHHITYIQNRQKQKKKSVKYMISDVIQEKKYIILIYDEQIFMH